MIVVRNPATDEVVGEVARSSKEDTVAAIARAEAAFRAWRALSAGERAQPLRRMAALMHTHKERLARLLTLEQGKPLTESRGEIAYAAGFLDWSAGEAPRLYGDIIPGAHRDQRIHVLRQPIGVSAAITPWNFPSAMITRKLGPALAAGCTMVVKPARLTPLSAVALRELATEAGIPEDAFIVVCGDSGPIGDAIMESHTVRMVSFTGSTEVGKLLFARAAATVKRLGLELGGHAPFLVFDDADLDAAVAGAIASKYRNAGQTCICANRFLVQEGIYDRFAARLAAAVDAMPIGAGLEEGTLVGPLIDDDAVVKVQEHIEDAVSKGARLRTGGRLVTPRPGLTNRFFAPTVLDDVTDDMLVSREETFGPVAPLRRFRTEEEAVAIANDTEYGLAAYFYTKDISRAMRVAEGLEYGIVGANDGGPSTPQAPFGGFKESGIGREGGRYGMDEYTEIKYVSWRI